ncbi:hypothetical protein K6V72_01535 [Ralstonia insidiosa]|jgi:hypothetical protein|uniref:Uncharacterized protein n=1 Tax=Ralstonia insidiosa TaxID=190721 RepID=A0A191ZVI4_9RALS|nr:hypothetical protein [Ralstonia insidiosa]ANJ72101.1 hypothetical protein A9Y76_06330 [Ralstonia insidiosa]KAB0472724.1 hypothetical protein F7R11_09245 [Ralstonia insidiosa]MBY4907660.1 hypothetical protein [Ralstonia insidiosa]
MDIKSLRAKEREGVLKVVFEGSFLDGVFQVERFNRVSMRTRSYDELPLADIYPTKTQAELRNAIAQVRQLGESALTYVSAVIDKCPERDSLLSKMFEDNPGFCKQTYDLALNDAFIMMR